MKVKTICTTRRAKLVIAVLWIVATICAIPEIFTRVRTTEKIYGNSIVGFLALFRKSAKKVTTPECCNGRG